MGFCLSGVLSDGVLSDGVLSDGVLSDGVLSWIRILTAQSYLNGGKDYVLVHL